MVLSHDEMSLIMYSSFSDVFSVGIGPSSSHTVGPMKAARAFCLLIPDLSLVSRIQTVLYGSLAHTGKGHGTHNAVLMGLEGFCPDKIDASTITPRVECILKNNQLNILGKKIVPFCFTDDLCFDYDEVLQGHPNAMRFKAFDHQGVIISEAVYYSIGGGFIQRADQDTVFSKSVPFPFETAEELFGLCQQHGMRVADLVRHNELSRLADDQLHSQLLQVDQVMMQSIERGMQQHSHGPLALIVNRRAPLIYQKVIQHGDCRHGHPHPMNWLNLFAIAVSEENAIGARVVTAPTNGAAGIIPAVMRYHRGYDQHASDHSIAEFLLTATAICNLYKHNASISGAEMGCQGEVGVACSMAAAGLAAARGASLTQVENAAEIAMEHNLGLTCDPVGGFVQIPCIERNGMGAVKAVNACSLALTSEDVGCVRLDHVIKTMAEIGRNMNTIYKETSQGGLAVNVPEC